MTITYDVILTRDFDAPLERVWNAWREPEMVKRWWGPTGFTAPVANMDFREGGRSLVCMRAPQAFGGQDFYNTWTYTKIEPLQRIEYLLRFADASGAPQSPAALGLPPGIPQEVPHEITFEPLGAGKTRVRVTERGYASEQTRDISTAGMNQCLEKMAAALGT